MAPLSRLFALVTTFALSLGVLGAPAEASDDPSPLGGTKYCSCPTLTRCGKVAAGCSASCSGSENAHCTCADPGVLCSVYGPYGSFTNSCSCW